ncbi:GNAT family N-acetyltransferase [Leptolinea tardivitalis]|uniref:GNAT family N-acetyltransferase n=1 Tax=Leptolinea tardivitalis TaxID=229920 RepID=UPI00078092A4|nr:GNAT family protein [Leptolinea tardivitalis]GAP21729.1 acetyltransferase [Leptolinea tardivitalis]
MFEEDIMAGKWLHLTEIDPEEDAAVEATWTCNSRYRLLMEYDLPRGYIAGEMKKYYETCLEKSDSRRREFYFAMRANTDNRFAGVFTIPSVEWTNRAAQFCIGFGEQADLQNWGDEAFRIALRYMFTELNLYLVTIHIPQFFPEMVEMAENAGLQLSARRREAVYYNGRRWAALHFSMLLPEWQALQNGGH